MSASPVTPRPLTISYNQSTPNSRRVTNFEEDFDCVRVEISDLDGTCPNQTTLNLLQCKKRIILPFRRLLCLIGWRPFDANRLKRPSLCLRIINTIYPIFIFFLLLFNYGYEVLLCPGQLNVIVDTETTTSPPPTTTATHPPNETVPWSDLVPGSPITMECGHIFTTYLLPDIFHCLAFIIGFINFRVTEGEPLYSLMEKVFINADENVRVSGTNRAIKRINLFTWISGLWVLLSVGTSVFTNIVHGVGQRKFFGKVVIHAVSNDPQFYILLCVDIVCLIISHCIYIAVVMNYVCHCEMIVFYCKAIRIRLEEKSIHLIEATKRILDLGVSISQLNGAASQMMSILIIVFLARTILGVLLLVLNKVFLADVWVYRSLFIVVWLSILIFCLGEASRVANKCNKFRRISLSMRVYGYHNSTTSELDGFLLFLSQANLRVKLFGVTVRPGKILVVGIAAFLVLVVLFQTSVLSTETFFF